VKMKPPAHHDDDIPFWTERAGIMGYHHPDDIKDEQIKFFKRLIDGVENSNHAAEQAMAKAYAALFPPQTAARSAEK